MAQAGSNYEKNGGQKTCLTVTLNTHFASNTISTDKYHILCTTVWPVLQVSTVTTVLRICTAILSFLINILYSIKHNSMTSITGNLLSGIMHLIWLVQINIQYYSMHNSFPVLQVIYYVVLCIAIWLVRITI